MICARMIVRGDGTPAVIIGLTLKDIEDLLSGQGMVLDLNKVGHNIHILIEYGDDEETLQWRWAKRPEFDQEHFLKGGQP